MIKKLNCMFGGLYRVLGERYIRQYVQEGFTTLSSSKMPLSSRVYHIQVPLGDIHKEYLPHILLSYISGFESLPCPLLCFMSCSTAQKIHDGEHTGTHTHTDRWLLDGMTTEHLLETETTGCNQLSKSVQVTAGSIRLAVPGDIKAEKHEC